MELSKKTVAQAIRRLITGGYACYPDGPRSGVAITGDGMDLFRERASRPAAVI